MNDFRNSDQSQGKLAGARVYEFSDFVPLASGDLYVQVKHQRTIYQPDGSIRKETVAKEILLERMVRAFRGTLFRSAGTLNAFFDDVEQARACAQAISLHHRIQPEVCGTQLTIPVSSDG